MECHSLTCIHFRGQKERLDRKQLRRNMMMGTMIISMKEHKQNHRAMISNGIKLVLNPNLNQLVNFTGEMEMDGMMWNKQNKAWIKSQLINLIIHSLKVSSRSFKRLEVQMFQNLVKMIHLHSIKNLNLKCRKHNQQIHLHLILIQSNNKNQKARTLLTLINLKNKNHYLK